MSFKIDGKENIIVYGAGERGRKIAESFYKNGFCIKSILDKRANEIKKIVIGDAVVCVVDPCEYIVSSCDEVVVISMQNALHHDDTAELLNKIGFKNIIYCPLHTYGNKKLMSEMRQIFSDIVSGKCFFDCIPEYTDIIASTAINYFDKEKYIRMPIENLFVNEILHSMKGVKGEYKKYIMEGMGENLINFRNYYKLFQFLDKAEGECEHYLKAQIGNSENELEEKRRVLNDRYRLFQVYENNFSFNWNFFIESASPVVWNKKGYFNLCDGHHRAMYLFYKGIWDIPVCIREEDRRYVELWNQVPNDFWCESPYMVNQMGGMFRRKLNAIICSALLKKDVIGKKIYININDAGLLGRYCCRLGCGLCIDVENKEAFDFAKNIYEVFQLPECLRICTHVKNEEKIDIAIIDEMYIGESTGILAQVYILKIEKDGILHNNIKKNTVSYELLGKCFDGEREYFVIKIDGGKR